MQTLGLCLIVKNERDFLEACVASARAAVDETVIVDTGSSDGTIEVARSLADTFAEFPFQDNFSDARNFALTLVSTDWVLFLDADEQLLPREAGKLRDLILTTPASVGGWKLYRLNFFANGGLYSGCNLKLFRNRPEFRYYKRINESVEPSILEAGYCVERAPLTLNHFGHTRSVACRNKKAHMYLRLMREELASRPRDALLTGYIGLIERTLGNFSQALILTDRAMAMDSNSATLTCFRAHVLRCMGRKEEALDHYRRASGLRPADATYLNMVGVMNLELQRYAEAERAFEGAYRLEPQMAHALLNYGLAREAQGDFVAAAKWYQACADVNPGFLRDSFIGRIEVDPYRGLFYETIFGFAGLSYHLAYSKGRAEGSIPYATS